MTNRDCPVIRTPGTRRNHNSAKVRPRQFSTRESHFTQRNDLPLMSVTEIERPAFGSFLVVDQHQWRLSELRRPAWPWWGALVDPHAVRAAFDARIRRNTRAGERGAVVEADAGVLRWLAPGTQTSRITWSELTSDSADAVIAAQVRYFAARGTPVEWKLYDYDQPADLAQRLLAAGFVADDEELGKATVCKTAARQERGRTTASLTACPDRTPRHDRAPVQLAGQAGTRADHLDLGGQCLDRDTAGVRA